MRLYYNQICPLSWCLLLKKIVLNALTRIRNPMVLDEFFVPKLGIGRLALYRKKK